LGTVALGIGRVAKTKHHSSAFGFSRRDRLPASAACVFIDDFGGQPAAQPSTETGDRIATLTISHGYSRQARHSVRPDRRLI